jgi:hypothetical protein
MSAHLGAGGSEAEASSDRVGRAKHASGIVG